MHERRLIDGGSPACWQEQKEGFALIKTYRRTLAYAEKSPSYSGSYDSEGNVAEVYENIGPWDKAAALHERLVKHPGATRILRANGFKVEPRREGQEPWLMNKKGVYPRSGEIPVFGEISEMMRSAIDDAIALLEKEEKA